MSTIASGQITLIDTTDIYLELSQENIFIPTDLNNHPSTNGSKLIVITLRNGAGTDITNANGVSYKLDNAALTLVNNGYTKSWTTTDTLTSESHTITAEYKVDTNAATTYQASAVFTVTPVQQGQTAKSIQVSGEQLFIQDVNNNNTITPTSIVLNAVASNTSIREWYYKNGDNWISLNQGNASSYTVNPGTPINAWINNKMVIKVEATDTQYYDIITIAKLTTGANGTSATPITQVWLTNENINLAADVNGQTYATDVQTVVLAATGSTAVMPNLDTIIVPTDWTVTVTKTGRTAEQGALLNFHIPANFNLGATRIINIPVSSPSNTILPLTFTCVKQGQTGAQGPQGPAGTSVTIKGTLDNTSQLPSSDSVAGDGYIIGQDLWVYTGGTGIEDVHGFTNVGAIKGESAYVYIRYSATSSPASQSDISSTLRATDKYMGVITNTTGIEPQYNEYTWSLIAAPILYELLISDNLIIKNSANELSPSTITLSALQTIESSTTAFNGYYSIFKDNGSDAIASGTFNNGIATYTIPTNNDKPTTNLIFKLYANNASSTVLDSQTIPIIGDGAAGAPGAPGDPASTVQLSNENISFSAAADGTLVARTINVYLYGYTGTQQVTPIISNITNSISTTTIAAGTYTTDNTNHRIVIPITAKNATVSADSGEFTITVTSPISTILHINWTIVKAGAKGDQGATGTAGKGINSITEYYAASNNSSTAPSTWVSLTEAQTDWNTTNKYLWNSETITYTVGDADSYVHPHVVAIYTQDGAPGSPGAAGKGINTIVNYYLATNTSDASTVKNESGWTTTIQSVSRTKKYLWNYEIITYTSGNPQETDAAIIGMYAEDGTSSYTWIRYAATNTPTSSNMHTTLQENDKYIGIAAGKTSATASANYQDYVWAKIIGDNGITTYTWIKYAATTTPAAANMHNSPVEGDKYIGIAYNKTSSTESTNYSDYTWSQIIGEKGEDGVNGTTLYTWIVYASDASGSNISTSPTNKTYIGIKYGQTSATPSLNANDYTFVKYIGDQGVSAYVYIRYAPTATSSDMSITKRSTDRYIGIANSTSATAPSTYSGYQWSLIEASNPVLHEINVSDLVAIRNTGSTISYTPAQITLSATEIEGDQSSVYDGYYKIIYTTITDTTTTINLGTTATYTLPTDVELKQLTCSLYAENTYTTLLDTQTIKIIGDGAQGRQGEKGDNASIVFLTNENISFSADSTGKVSATDITCNVVAYNGTTKVTPIVGTVTGGITNQLTITKNTDISNEIPLTIHTNASVTLNNQTSGTISIPISYPVTTTLSIRWTKISNGKGIVSSTVKYAESSNGTTAPGNANDWKDSVPNISTGNFLWTRTQTTYTDGTSTTSYAVARQGADGTSVTIKGTLASKDDLPTSDRVLGDGYIIGQDLWVYTGGTASTDKNGFTNVGAIKGADGESVTILSKSVEYVSSTDGTTAPSTGWGTSIPTVSPGNYLWTRTTISFSDGNDIVSYSVSRNGTNGTNGYSTVIIYLYKRAATAPTIDWPNTLTYTFDTDTLNSIPTGWSRTIPTGTDNLYVTAATASSDSANDTIASGEWTTPSLLSSNGKDGQPGFNSATVFLYKRSASALSSSSTPINDLTYTFATGELTGNLENWSQTVPNNDGNPLYSIQATAISTSKSDTITSTEWSVPIKMVENGEDGDDGIGISSIITEYYLSTSDQTQTGGSWSDIMPTYAVDSYYWTRSKITWDNAVSDPNHITYTKAVLAAGLNSANELANEANELATTTNSDFRTTSSQIYSEVRQQTESINALNSDLNTVVEQLSTTINQTANDINLSITELRQQQSNTASTAQEINEKMQEITTYMKFDASGLSLGKTDSQLKVQLSNNELGFYDAEDKVAYINSNKMFITQAQITNQMLLGKYAFVPSGEHLALIYIG